MKGAVRGAIVAVVAAVGVFVLLPYWHASAMILRAADAHGILGLAARWDAAPISEIIEYIATPEGPVRVRIFRQRRPVGRATHAALLVSGVHPDGIDEPRLVNLARDLAGTGVNVVTPEIPDLMHYRLTAHVTDTIEHAAEWLAGQRDLAGTTPIAMLGVSFAGLSVVAAGRPALRNHVAYVLSLGGHGNLPRVLRYYCTGIEPSINGAPGARRAPHDYALAVLLHEAAEFAVPADQVEPLRRGVETFLRASSLARVDQGRTSAVFAEARTIQQALPEPAGTLMRDVNERNVAALGVALSPYLDRLGQDPALSPDRAAPPSAPVYLFHGTGDNVIPAVESTLLAAELAPKTRVRLLLTGFLSHVDVSDRPTWQETWHTIAFWKAALQEQ